MEDFLPDEILELIEEKEMEKNLKFILNKEKQAIEPQNDALY